MVNDSAGVEGTEDVLGIEGLLIKSIHGCLRIQCIEDGLYKKHVNTTSYQALSLLVVCLDNFVVGAIAKCWVFYAGRHRESPVSWSNCPCSETRLAWVLSCPLLSTLFCQLCGGLINQENILLGFKLIIRLRDASPIERIRLDDIGSCLQEIIVNLADYIGTGYTQQIIISFQIVCVVLPNFTTEILLFKLVTLDICPHGTINHNDTFLHNLVKLIEDITSLQRIDIRLVIWHKS